MKNVAYVVLALGMVACNNDRPNVVDSGHITIPDSGHPTDTNVAPGHDTGMASGPCTLTFAAGNFGSLSAGCFPRCTVATGNTAFAAGCDATCQDTAFTADPTPTAPWSVNGRAQTMGLNCGACVQFQQFHCLSANGCAAEVDALLQCLTTAFPDGGMPDCTTQGTTLDTCGMAHPAVGTCSNDMTMGIAACFGG